MYLAEVEGTTGYDQPAVRDEFITDLEKACF